MKVSKFPDVPYSTGAGYHWWNRPIGVAIESSPIETPRTEFIDPWTNEPFWATKVTKVRTVYFRVRPGFTWAAWWRPSIELFFDSFEAPVV